MIGVFDSGVGGLSVLRHIREELPRDRLAYVADSAWAPYGSRSVEEIRRRSQGIARFLLDEGATTIVVACNTATSAAVAVLRETLNVPIVGMEPGVKPAVLGTRKGIVGVLATEGTLAGEKFAALLEEHGRHARVIPVPCPGFVELVEKGNVASETAKVLVEETLSPVLAEGADVLVLGCTHYPFLLPLIRNAAGPEVTLIDSGIAVAREVARRVVAQDRPPPEPPGPQDRLPLETLWTSGEPAETAPILHRLWGGTSPPEVRRLPEFR